MPFPLRMRVLITGAAGFVGRHLIAELATLPDKPDIVAGTYGESASGILNARGGIARRDGRRVDFHRHPGRTANSRDASCWHLGRLTREDHKRGGPHPFRAAAMAGNRQSRGATGLGLRQGMHRQHLLGWKPQTSLEELCRLMVEADIRRNKIGFSF